MVTLNTIPRNAELTRQVETNEVPFAYPTVTAVIPARNEAKNLPYVLPRIPSMVSEIVLVDGKSTDDTIAVARSLVPDIRVINQTGKGKGDALRLGFQAATSDIIVMLDADGSMAPEEIPGYVGILMSGVDYVKGSRFLHGGGTDDMELHRYLGNLGLVMAVRALFGGLYSDLCYGYCAFWSRILPKLNLCSDGFEIETEMNVRALSSGIKVAEVPSFESKRVFGQSNLRAIPDGIRILKLILRERRAGRTMQARTDDGAVAADDHLWEPHLVEPVIHKEDYLTPAIDLLMREATHLAHRRDQMTAEAYEAMSDAIKAAFNELINMDTSDVRARRQQALYRRKSDRMWAFLEQAPHALH